MTVWLHSENCEGDAPVRVPHEGGAPRLREALRDLAGSAAQRVLSRAVYAEEYAESLRECMGGAPTGQLEAMLFAHEKHVHASRAHPATALAVEVARALRDEAAAHAAAHEGLTVGRGAVGKGEPCESFAKAACMVEQIEASLQALGAQAVRLRLRLL